MNKLFGQLWAGTELSHRQAQAALEKIEARMLNYEPHDDEDEIERNYTVKDGVGIISIKGSMLNMDIPFEVAKFFGVTSYPELQRQIAAIAVDPTVERVVLDVNSGGGHVSGLYETFQMLKELRAVKPVATYCSDMMASAAYWLGCVGEKIVASPMATVGSIGVIAVHVSIKEAMLQEGCTPTVFRAGTKKHLGHELEDLTPEASDSIQESLDFAHYHFMSAVAEMRGMSFEGVKSGIGDGRVFYGTAAKDVHLVDEIGNFSDLLSVWASPKPVFSGIITTSAEGYVPGQAIFGDLNMNLEEALAQVQNLQGQLSEQETALAAANGKIASLENDLVVSKAACDTLAASLASTQKSCESFTAVLEANINSKATALNLRVLMPDTLEGKQALNAQLDEEFQQKFPAGGVAAAATQCSGGQQAEKVDTWLKYVSK